MLVIARRYALLGTAALVAGASPALAQTAPQTLPTGGAFVRGDGEISQTGPGAMVITQSSTRGVIDWSTFSIGKDGQVDINNGAGATLNRVLGGQISQIDGRLSATGSVYLMNPAGVIVGTDGSILSGGNLVVSTRPMNPDAFMGGGPLAASGTSYGTILNEGQLQSQSGSVVMIARSVTNAGTVQASQGRVTLAAADDVLLTTSDADGKDLFVSVAEGGDGDVTQTGRIRAAAVSLHAAGGNIFALAGNRDGLIQATGSETIDGQLWLTAPKGEVRVAGALAATQADGGGGQILINGQTVTLEGTANVAATGMKDGEVLIGTSAFGTAADLAAHTTIAEGASLRAGGPAGGGRIETSGQTLAFAGARIDPGKGGLWLLDPDDLTIDAAAAATIVSTLDGGSNVNPTTTAGGTGGSGDLTVAAPIVWTGTGDLTLTAYRDLNVNAAISGGGWVTFEAGRDATIAAPVSATAIATGSPAFAGVAGTYTIAAGGSLTGALGVGVVGGSFVNQAGAGAISSSAEWFILTDGPGSTTLGGLTPDYFQYDFLTTQTAASTGNAVLYRVAPTATVTLGTITKVYDGTTTAILNGTNTTVTGLLGGDDWALDGAYSTKDAGTGLTVTASNFQATNGGIPVYGYAVSDPAATTTTAEITRASLTAAIINTPTKVYNASNLAQLVPSNVSLTGVVAGETITVNGAATTNYDSANAGARTVTATFGGTNFVAGAATNLNNYVLPTNASGAGLITQAPLTVLNVSANNKVYDGTTTASLSTGSAALFGVIGSEDVALSTASATGLFATKNVGTGIAVTASGFSVSGAGAANYQVLQPTGLSADITRATLQVASVTINDKVYDGTRTATADTSSATFLGLISGDDVSVTSGAFTFDSKDVGDNIAVRASDVQIGGADGGNYNVVALTPFSADITPAPLVASIIGNPTKTYDGNTQAAVSPLNFQLTGFVAGENASIVQTSGATYASKDAGSRMVSATLSPPDYVADAGTALSNYILPILATGLGTIDPAQLTITIVGNPTKAYDGTPGASLGSSNFEVDGFIPGEGATVTETSGTYSSSDAGTRTVSADLDAGDFDPDSGTLMSNYIIPSPVTGIGTITRRDIGPGTLYADITGNSTKTYDGNTIATLTPSDYTLTGFIAGEGATITQTVGTYGDKNAGQQSVIAYLAPTDFTADVGTNLDNYNLPTEATGIGTILRAQLTAAIIGNPTKVYNGSTNAILTSANFSFTGFVPGEGASLPATVGTYSSEDAGTRIVSKTLSPTAFVADAGTLLSNYVLPTLAVGAGTINQAPLTILNVSAADKVYDTTTTAQLAGTATLFGLVDGDIVGLDGVGATGTFASRNVGSGIAVTASGYALTGADQANYVLTQPQGLTASITPKGVQILGVIALDKIYDATTTATLNLGGATLDGVFAGDAVGFTTAGAAGAFGQSHVGTGLHVNASGFALNGTDAGNYALSQPSYLTAAITPKQLTGAIIGTPTRTYDATTQAFLTSSNYSVSGFVAGQSATVTQAAGAAYDSPDAGARTVTATVVVSDFQAGAGTDLSNYLLPTTLTGPGLINRLTLAAAIIGNPTKVYDATQTATLTSANYSLTGFVAGQGATVTQTSGLYASKNVGNRSISALLTDSDFTATGSTNLANYNLPNIALGGGMITPASVSVTDVVALDKVYDGTTAAGLDNSLADLSGILGADTVTVDSSGSSGVFATKNVGTNIAVTATGYALAGADAGNYVVVQPTGLAADISQATLALASVTRVYTATTTAPTNDSAYALSGVFGADVVTVTAAGITGDYDTKNVGTGKAISLAGVAIAGADAGNYLIASTTTNAPIGTITPAQLTTAGAVANDRVYDQTTNATIDNSGTTLNGVLLSDDVTLTVSNSGQFSDKNVGTNKPVTTTGYSVSGVDAGNYVLQQPNYLTADITPFQIFLTSVSKTYDGTTALPTDSAAYGFSGVFSGDAVSASPAGATGAYAGKNVGGSLSGGVVTAGIDVSVANLSLSGTDAGNYVVSDVVNQAIGVISPKALIAAIIGNPTKTYDTTTTATLTSANYSLTGFVSGEGATVTETVGAYDSKNAGARTVTASLGGGDFTADGGTLLTNYVLPASASGAGQISQALLTVAGAVADNKVYDGTTNATITNTGTSLVGVLGSDAVTLTNATTGQFADANVGTAKSVTTNGYSISGTDAPNYILQQPNYLTADITQALLTLVKVTRVYTAFTPLPTDGAAYSLAGIVSGDDVAVDASGIIGDYATKNVGTNINVTFTGLDLTGADAGNYSIATALTNAAIGEITPATVTLTGMLANTKIYDGTTALTLNNTGTTVVGTLGSDDLGVNSAGSSAAFGSPNVGTYSVAASGYLLTGIDAGNYVLTQPGGISATIDPKALSAAIVGTPTRTYDATSVAALTSANYSLTGFIGSEGATVTETVGTYDSPNAGARTVTATLTAGDFTAGGGTLLSNYILPTSASGAGQIDPKTLTAAIIGDPTRIYDATTVAGLTNANYQLTGFVGSEGALVTETVGAYDSANAGARTVTAILAAGDFTATGTTLLANYILPTSASGVGHIRQATLSAAIIGTPTKVYDATTGATLTSANYSLTGFVGSEGATVTETVGVYDGANAGARTVTATLGAGDFTADGGTLLSNYVLPISAAGAGQIDQKSLAAIIIGNPTRTYNGTDVAALTSANYSLTGFVGSESASVTRTAGTYAGVNAGPQAVTTSLLASDFLAGAGTSLSNYILPTSAAGLGIITQAILTATIVGLPTKTYDATTGATLTGANYSLTGFVTGEGADVTRTTGVYVSADAGIRNVSTTLASGDFTATGSTLLSNYVLPTSASGGGVITKALLTAAVIGDPTRAYDATTVATLTSANYQLTGFVGGQGATVTETVGTYSGKDVGARTVSVALGSSDFTANGGTSLANYTLPTTASGIGHITQAALTAAIIGNPTRTYDATTGAVLTSSNYSLTGFAGSEGATVTETVGAYSSANAGSRTVTAALDNGDFTATGSTLLSNYVLPTAASGAGTIDPKALTAAVIGDPTKTYDATAVAAVTSANYSLTGFVGSEGATVTETVGAYGSPNAGVRIVTATLTGADFTADGGTSLSNYILPTSATGIGHIDQATLTAAIIGAPTKTYDATTGAALTSSNYALTGFIGSESASVTETVGTYDSANAGARTVTALLDAGDFTAGGGTLLSNYVLPTTASGAGQIDQATLIAAIIGNPAKVYDATTGATLTSTNYSLTGFIGAEGATVTQTVGSYDSANAGARTVTASLGAGDFTAIGSTQLSNYILPTNASGAGAIDQKSLTAVIIGDPTRVYDATTVAALTSANYQLTGFVGTEGATVTETAGVYDSANAGARTVTATLTGADFTADGGTLLSNYILPTGAAGAGHIAQATLTAAIIGNPTKTYDATTGAVLTSINYSLTGFIGAEGATVTEIVGAYDSANAGSRTVTATLDGSDFTADGSTLLSNYVLPTTASGAGQIDQATLTAAIIGNPTKVYDATTGATLTATNYSLTGFIGAEGATVTETIGTYDSANAGSRAVTAALDSGDFTATGSTLLSNYVLPTTASGAGQIDQKALTAAIIGDPTKTYDATTVAALNSANYSLAGFVGAEGATVTETVGAYDSANAGARIVTATLGGSDFTATGSTLLSNYLLPTTASGVGHITQAALTAAIIGNPTKVYDANTGATLTGANYSLTGFIGSEGAAVTETVGAYDSANAGSRTVTAALDGSDFTATGSTLLSNYILPTSASGAGAIDQKTLTAAIIGDPTRVYDATDVAVLTSANYSLTGFVGTESATVTETAGTYASPNAGLRIVTAILTGADFTADGATLLSNYVLPTSASGIGHIDQATLTAAIIGNPTKVYDANTGATLTGANYTLTGFIGSESAGVTETVGTYDSANAGSRTVTAILDSGDFTAGGGTLLSNYVLPTSASGAGQIDQKTLTAALVGVAKTYDGTTDAVLAAGNYTLSGFVGSEGATVTETAGTYASPNVGSHVVTAGLDSGDFTATGSTSLSNYILPTTAVGIGQIGQAQLLAAIIGDPTRVYDATTIAGLTSANYSLTGFIGTDGATITEAVGTYGSPNAGLRTITAALDAGDFTATGSTLLSNYILPTSAAGTGHITQALLTAAIIGAPTKVYDATTAASLVASNYSLTGFVGSEGATVTETVGTYDSQNAGARTVVATLDGSDFTATGSTLLSNYVLPVSASGAGTIDQKTLTAALVGVAKTYDGTTDAALGAANYALTGFVGAEGATVTETVGIYASPNAGARVVTAGLDSGDFTATGSTLLANYILPTSALGIGQINQAALTAAIIGNPTRTYDATTGAVLTSANYSLTGFIGSEGATVTETVGTYNSANAGARMVTASLDSGDFTAGSGTLLSNYLLPTTASGAGQIDQKTLTAALIGVAKTYDGTTAALLASANYSLSGFVGSEGATVTETAGTYASANVGSRVVSASLDSGDFTATGATLLANYVLPTSAPGIGQISQAALTAAIIGDPTRTYDATAVAALTSANYQLTGFVAGEGATVAETVGAYASPNAGPRTVTAALDSGDFTADGSTLLSNYILPASALGLGHITPAALTATIIGDPSKTYDGTRTATLTSANYSLTGFIGSEGATVTETVGVYDSADAGARIVTASLDGGDFTASGSTLLTNYIVPTNASGAGTINPKALTAAIIGDPTRTYDATTVATLTSANYQLAGFVAGEGAAVSETVGLYDSPNAGGRTLTVSLGAGDFSVTGSTRLSNYILPTSATGTGHITQAALTAAIVGTPTRTYDATTGAILTSANYQLTGFVGAEGATVTETVGTYDGPNAGARTATAALDSGDFTANGGTLLSNYSLPTLATGAGVIDRALLQAAVVGNPTRTYNATVTATLTASNYQLTGFVGSEGATVTETVGAYDSANAGARTVSVSLGAGDFAAAGSTLLSNYVLPTSASGAGQIDRAVLSAAIIGDPTKTFDGTTTATLTSANYGLSGFVGGESAAVTQTLGAYAAPEIGAHTVTASLTAADYQAAQGTLLANYVLPESASGEGHITSATPPAPPGPTPCRSLNECIDPDDVLPVAHVIGTVRFYVPYPVINSTGQILRQGGRAKRFSISFPPRPSGEMLEARP